MCVYFLQKLSYSNVVSNQNLVIYKFTSLYHILEELHLDLNFKIIFVDSENSLNDLMKNLKNYLIVSNKKYPNIEDKLVIINSQLNIFKLLEKINVEFLKLQFSSKSEVRLNNYIFDLNSREMKKENKKIKLTEKEMNTIIFLSKSNEPINIDELQKKVWSYQPDIETHTVETHIYRLRKKILNTFDENEFIVSKKNGYQIK